VPGDVVWPQVLADAAGGALQPVYEAGRVDAERLPRTWKRSRCLVTSALAVDPPAGVEALSADLCEYGQPPTDSARVSRANRWARLIAKSCRRVFVASPMPALVAPARKPAPRQLAVAADNMA
jgi:hypothetical protein